jgi:hypothetical protein
VHITAISNADSHPSKLWLNKAVQDGLLKYMDASREGKKAVFVNSYKHTHRAANETLESADKTIWNFDSHADQESHGLTEQHDGAHLVTSQLTDT